MNTVGMRKCMFFVVLNMLLLLSLNPLQTGVRSGIRMAQMPLPEITKEDFLCAWTQLELVASAKEWNEGKRATVLPTLLRRKLVDIYIKLSGETRANLAKVKKALVRRD